MTDRDSANGNNAQQPYLGVPMTSPLTYEQLTPAMLEPVSVPLLNDLVEPRFMVERLLFFGWLPPEVVAYRIREAERKAWDTALSWSHYGDHFYPPDAPFAKAQRDFYLPALPDPLVAEPPTLKLSTGEWRRRKEGCWEPCNSEKSYFNYISPDIKTVEDCDKLRAWLMSHGESR